MSEKVVPEPLDGLDYDYQSPVSKWEEQFAMNAWESYDGSGYAKCGPDTHEERVLIHFAYLAFNDLAIAHEATVADYKRRIAELEAERDNHECGGTADFFEQKAAANALAFDSAQATIRKQAETIERLTKLVGKLIKELPSHEQVCSVLHPKEPA